ncbi:MAG: hypothetical protein J0L92_32835, partial [Deltaproteobacteria bacterium]|nr:hypothetical protein [Deltaproteobacteria bacterium]
MPKRLWLPALLTLLASSLACACDPRSPVDTADAATPPSDAGPSPRYEEDVRPIVHARCVGCHRAGQIAPFALDTYESVAPLATRIAEVTRARTMPPFLAEASGACGTYRDARWLTEPEIDTLARWAAAGAP